MRKQLTFGGKSLTDFDTFFDGSQLFITPQKSVEKVSVIGRNGDLIIDNNRFENVTIPVNCFIRTNFQENYAGLMNYLLSRKGYQKLETSNEPDIYRMAQFVASIEPNTGAWNNSGQFTLEFDCKPEKWLKSGEIEVSVIAGTGDITLFNPTNFIAKPLIHVKGGGAFTVNGYSYSVNQTATQWATIDCENMDVYRGSTNLNPYYTYVTKEFPELNPGANVLRLGNAGEIKITPRWWTV